MESWTVGLRTEDGAESRVWRGPPTRLSACFPPARGRWAAQVGVQGCLSFLWLLPLPQTPTGSTKGGWNPLPPRKLSLKERISGFAFLRRGWENDGEEVLCALFSDSEGDIFLLTRLPGRATENKS